MKKSFCLIAICIVFIFSGCGLSQDNCLQSAQNVFPDDTVYFIDGFRYLSIRDNGDIFFIGTDSLFSANVTDTLFISNISEGGK